MAFVRLPAGWAALRDTCIASLEAWLSDKRPLYAIVDLASATDAAHWHDRLKDNGMAQSLFQDQPESAAARQAPWLLPVTAKDARIGLRHTVEEGLVARNVSWISSTLPIDILARRLSRRLTAHLSGSEVLFRYYDTRLLEGWWAVLSEEDRASFGSFGTRWGVLDAAGELQTIALAGEPETDPFQPPWRISPPQQRALVTLSECQQLVDLLGKRRPDVFLEMDRGARWLFVRAQDAQAKARHVLRLADRLRYCELALDHGDSFADEARWQPVWGAMATGSLRLADALEQLLPDTPSHRPDDAGLEQTRRDISA